MVRLDNDTAVVIVAMLENVAAGDAGRAAIEAIRGQLERPQFHGEVVERMSQLLSRPNARNIISGDNLLRLRKALLSPREMAELEVAINKGVACIDCGVTIRPHELCSHDGISTRCFRCMTPKTITCKCGSNLLIDLKAKIQRAQRECKVCQRDAQKVDYQGGGMAPAAPEPDPPANPAVEPLGLRWNEGMRQFIANRPPIVRPARARADRPARAANELQQDEPRIWGAVEPGAAEPQWAGIERVPLDLEQVRQAARQIEQEEDAARMQRIARALDDANQANQRLIEQRDEQLLEVDGDGNPF